MLERDIEKDLGQQLKRLGCLFYKFTSPGARGVPDRIVVCPDGTVIFAELKRAEGILSPAQRLQIRRLRDHGQDVRVIRGAEEARALVQDCGGHRHEV